MVELSVNQFTLVSMVFSFTMGAMAVAAVFFYSQRTDVLPQYRTGVTLLSLVSLFAGYNYYRLHASWTESFRIVGNAVQSTGTLYTETHRYTDWLLTVPLLLAALVLVLDLPARQARVRSIVLAILAIEMIGLGYPGLIATTVETKWLWWCASMVPFLLIMFQLFVSLAKAVAAEPKESRRWVVAARFVTVITWSFYPVVYMLPMLGFTGTNAFVATQVGYAIADLTAKALYGVLICLVATSKSGFMVEAAAKAPPMRNVNA